MPEYQCLLLTLFSAAVQWLSGVGESGEDIWLQSDWKSAFESLVRTCHLSSLPRRPLRRTCGGLGESLGNATDYQRKRHRWRSSWQRIRRDLAGTRTTCSSLSTPWGRRRRRVPWQTTVSLSRHSAAPLCDHCVDFLFCVIGHTRTGPSHSGSVACSLKLRRRAPPQENEEIVFVRRWMPALPPNIKADWCGVSQYAS